MTATDAPATDARSTGEPWHLQTGPQDAPQPTTSYEVLGQRVTVPVEVRSATMVQASSNRPS